MEGEGEKGGERADKEKQENTTTLKKESTLSLPFNFDARSIIEQEVTPVLRHTQQLPSIEALSGE